MIAIPNMEKPNNCQECPIFLWCYTANDWKGYEHCPLIEIVRCKDCIHFHYDKPYIIQGIPVLGHEVCDFWGDGCKTNLNGFCSYGERRNDVNDTERD